MLLPSEVVVDPYAEFLRGNVASALALADRLGDPLERAGRALRRGQARLSIESRWTR
jgi:hypothetical protein